MVGLRPALCCLARRAAAQSGRPGGWGRPTALGRCSLLLAQRRAVGWAEGWVLGWGLGPEEGLAFGRHVFLVHLLEFPPAH